MPSAAEGSWGDMMSRFSLGSYIYSPDIDEIPYETPADLVVGLFVRTLIAPFRITSRVMKSIFMMGDNFRAAYSTPLIVFGVAGVIAGALYAASEMDFAFLVSQLICVAMGVLWKIKYAKTKSDSRKVRTIRIKTEVIENIMSAAAVEIKNIAALEEKE